MADIILHHYWESPYAEKIRRILGFKQLAWNSVIIPMIMPKPDLLALTGGYRKTPVLQIGADIYCDTDCIARTIDRLHPKPSLFPEGTDALSYMVGPWQGELFLLAVQAVGMSGNVFPEGFVEDRSTMFEGGMDIEKLLTQSPARRDQLRAKLDLLDRQLGRGRAFVLGDAPSLADFSLFHPVFALRMVPATTAILEPFAHVRAWMSRIEGFGHGQRTDISSAEALEIARGARPATAPGVDPGDPNDRKPGDRVEVVHKDFGRDPVVGELVASSPHEIAIRRRDDRAGEVVVHFPREHYTVMPA
jgi:glutathione S-transferase